MDVNRLDGNPYCDSNPTVCNATQAPTPSATPNSSANASQCSNSCPLNYATNRKDYGNCQCTYPIVCTCTFYATKIPILSAYITEIEHNLTVGLSDNPYLEGLSLQDTQAVVDIISSNTVKVSIFPPSSLKVWPQSNATFISYVIQNHDIAFSIIGPMACYSAGSRYAQSKLPASILLLFFLNHSIAWFIFQNLITLDMFYVM